MVNGLRRRNQVAERMKLIMSHNQGNANVRASAIGLERAQLLASFYTSIACFPGSVLDSMGNIPFLSEIRRRRFDPVLKPYTHTSPAIELSRLISLRAGFSNFTKHETGIFSIESAMRNIDKKVASTLSKAKRNNVSAVYAYEDGALFTFRRARQLGLKCFYDLPIGYWRTGRELLEKEKERWPEWASTIVGFKDSAAKLALKDEEINLADCIFVASNFTARTLKDFPGKLPSVEVIPYGFPAVGNMRSYNYGPNSKALKLLFVGSLSQRKGIADLIAAVENIGPRVALTIIGRKVTNECSALNTALAKHTYIPSLPHHEILKIMRESDVLVFPSLFEGFGLVITEAMSQGTPVITTERTAGPDLIRHGENGWLVEAGTTHALQNTIEEILAHPGLVEEMGTQAYYTASARPWEAYGNELAAAIKKQIN